MSRFRTQFRLYTVALIAALLVLSNLLVYTGFHSLLQQYLDRRLFGIADTLAELIEQRPELLKRPDHELVVPRGAQVADERMQELREVSHSVHILSLDGTVVWEGSAVVPRPPVDGAMVTVAFPSGPWFGKYSRPNCSGVRPRVIFRVTAATCRSDGRSPFSR